jgi:hypothetical protein
MVKKMIGNFMGTMVAVPLVGASASMVNTLPAGTAKDLAGTAVGLQGVALVGHSLKAVPGMGMSHKRHRKMKHKKMKYM